MENRKMLKIKKRFEENSNSKGITLVALVITIIIIIILAVVTINFAFGDNGLIKQAELAKDLTVNDTEYETDAMSNLVTYINEIIGEITNPPQKEKAVIKVNNTTIILTYRDTTQINASIEKGDGIIKYEIIEGENAITVSETGLIKGVEPGKAKIRVSMDATENYEAADDIIIEVIVTEIV